MKYCIFNFNFALSAIGKYLVESLHLATCLFSTSLGNAFYAGKCNVASFANPNSCSVEVHLRDDSSNFTSVYTTIPSCRWDESKTSFPLLEGIFVYSRAMYHKILLS